MAGTIENPQSQSDTAVETTPNGAPPAGADAPNGAAQAPPAPPLEPGVVVPDDASRLCVSCAALLEEGQDWCLECGTAQPGRLGGKPGWRAALVVVALTTLLVAGAVAAAYAALSSDAERTASAPPPQSAQPVVPPAPVDTPPAPVDETPVVPAPDSDPAPKSSDSGSSDSAPSTPAPSTDSGADDTAGDDFTGDSGSTSSSGTSGSGFAEDEGDAKPKPKPSPIIALSPGAASTFDPHDRAGGLTGDPADAIDGRRGTAWEAPVNADGKVDIGLLVSLDEAKAIDRVRLQAGTPGFTVELYGSKLGTAPDAAPGATKYWTKLDDTRDFGTDERLNAGGGTYRHVLLWFTDQPADTKVMIPELMLLKDLS